MPDFSPNAAEIFRDYVTDGVPPSGTWNPRKSEIREYLTELETAAQAVHLASYDTVADVEAATVDASFNAVQTLGYYAAADGGGALYGRVVAEPSHAGKIQSADGAWWELELESRFNVLCQGAKGDGTTDCLTAVRASAAAVKAAVGILSGSIIDSCPALLLFPPGGKYRITGSIDLQSIKAYGWGIVMSGAVVIAECTGKTLFDCLGSAYGFFRDIHIVSAAATAPARAFQLGRITHDAAPAGGHLFSGTHIDGHFSDSIIFNAAGEGNVYLNLQLRNNHASGHPCMTNDGYHAFAIITDFTTSAWPANSSDSCIQHTFINTDCATAGGPAFLWSDAQQVRFIGGNYAVTQSGAIHLYYASADTFVGLEFDKHVETFGSPTGLHYIEFRRFTSGVLRIQHFRIHDDTPFGNNAAVDSLVHAGENITTLVLDYVDIFYGLTYNQPIFSGTVQITNALLNGVPSKSENKFIQLGDDQATFFIVESPALHSQTIIVHCYGGAAFCGIAFINTDSITGTALLAGASFVATTGALAGTTGTDGKVTISAGSSHQIYLENRSGAESHFSLQIIGH